MARVGVGLVSLSLCALAVGLAACAAKNAGAGYTDDDGGNGGPGGDVDGGVGNGGDGTPGFGNEAGEAAPQDGDIVVTTTIYANTDDSLYSMDPKTRAVTLIGKFSGADGNVTDVAVNGAGDVYVNTEATIYKAALPATPGTVALTKVATIAAKKTGQQFFALAFAPAGVLGPNESLVGGDGDGELWWIDTGNGATKDLGSFGTDPKSPTKRVLALSGDLVFYNDATNKPTGLATIRSCPDTTGACDKTSDYLAGIDMAALSAAYTSGTPAKSLLGGIYGGSGSNPGTGTGSGEVFGLGAWEGDVYGFTRGTAPSLILIDTGTGAGNKQPGSFSFTNGWSGAGVTTKVTINVPPPPPVK